MSRRSNAKATVGPRVVDDCWNTIGVHGDASCPELAKHVHCHHCPTYSAAAVALLNRDTPIDYLADWTRQISQTKQAEESDDESAIIFRIGPEWFALPTGLVDEVTEMRSIHSLPNRRNGILLGLANVRGELVVCVSLRKMLGVEDVAVSKEEDERLTLTRLLVIRYEERRIAFPVDEVNGIHRYHQRELTGVPATLEKAPAAYTKAVLSWDGKTIGCLDDRLVFPALDRSIA